MRLFQRLRENAAQRHAGPASPGAKRARLKQVVCILVAGVVVLPLLLFGLTGCVTDEELAAAMEAQQDEAITGDPGELDTLEEAEAEENEPRGIIEQLAAMLGSRSSSVQIVALLTVLSLAPSLLMMLTGFVRIIMVLSFTRNALGLQQMPPNQVLVGLALFLTLFVMAPVVDEIKTEAYVPYVAGQIELDEALERGSVPLREFMLRQTRSSDLQMFSSFAGEEMPETQEELMDVPMRTLIPAFLTSELKRAFEIGFFIYIPFIVIDMIVASTLMAMGMMMLPPITISLPFKVLLFVVVDGWGLTMQTLLAGFG